MTSRTVKRNVFFPSNFTLDCTCIFSIQLYFRLYMFFICTKSGLESYDDTKAEFGKDEFYITDLSKAILLLWFHLFYVWESNFCAV